VWSAGRVRRRRRRRRVIGVWLVLPVLLAGPDPRETCRLQDHLGAGTRVQEEREEQQQANLATTNHRSGLTG